MRPVRHNDGSFTFWSVYRQQWIRTQDMPSDEEMSAMPQEDRRRICLHLASTGNDEAQEWLDSQREPTGLDASFHPIDVGFDVRIADVAVSLPAGERIRVRWEENGETCEMVGTPDQIKAVLKRAGYRVISPVIYRVIVGEVGNEQGHIIPVPGNHRSAEMTLRRELAKYRGDGWGRVEYSFDGENWEREP